jgi:hypothetical protein
MEIAGTLVIALLGGIFIALIWTAIMGGPWSIRPMIAIAVSFAIAIWIGLAGPLKLG